MIRQPSIISRHYQEVNDFIGTAPQLVLGNPNVSPTRILPPHTYDLRNFIRHSMEFLQKNERLTDQNKLFVFKSRALENNADVNWTDAQVIETLNKSTLYRPVLTSYRRKVTDFINNDNVLPYLPDFHPVSKDVVNAVLNLVYTIQGLDGILSIRTNLSNLITPGARFDPECLKVYNLLIYSAPFVLTEAFLNPTTMFTQEMFFNAPYESIATFLHQHMLVYDYPNLNFIIRTQMRIENSLPEITAMRAMYDAAITMYRTTRLIGTVGSVITPIIPIGGILLRALRAHNIPIEIEPVIQGDDEIVDVCVRALVLFILD